MNAVLKKIIPRGLLLFLPFFLYYFCYLEYLIIAGKFKNDGDQIYKCIAKSKKKVKKKKIVLGDSIGSQLYSPYEDSGQVYSLCATGPSQIMGVYVLLQNFVAVNDVNDKEFYYIIHPHTFGEQVRTKYAYNHFVKPFYTLDNMKYFDESLRDSVHGIPYWYAAQVPFIKISDFQPVYDYTNDTSGIIPSINIEYLKKINDVVMKNHLNFHVLMPYIDEIYRNEDYTNLKNAISQNGLDTIFSGYFKNIRYLPDSEFKPDHGHYADANKVRAHNFGI
jgi:hypothetical protein